MNLFLTIAKLINEKKITLINARGEHACNSSSSHSIIVLDSKRDVSFKHSDVYTDSTTKIRMLANFIDYKLPALADELREVGEKGQEYDDPYEALSDAISIPQNRFEEASEEFMREVAKFLERDDVVVVDTSYSDEPLPKGAREAQLPATDKNWNIRKDTLNGETWWVLFNMDDGTKLRLKLGELDETAYPQKAPAPELVDIKVTDRCPFEKDCGFCYMGSTVNGKPGDIESISNLLVALSEMGVFEIAFGGGEPTMWEPFKDAMRMTSSLGMVPNFTSKNYLIMERDPEMIELAGSVAFSVNDSKSLHRFQKSFHTLNYFNQQKICIQIIPEMLDEKYINEVMYFCEQNRVRLTLLGFKRSGRGESFDLKGKTSGFWIPIAEKYPNLRLAIDTALAENSLEELQAAKVPSWCYHTQEGKFSMYCDTVEGKTGASSYSPLMRQIDFKRPDLLEELQERFKRY